MSTADEVGSVGEEALRLLRALGAARSEADDSSDHACPNGWCPACGVATFVREHPEIITSVTDSAALMLRAVRDAFEPSSTKDVP